MDVIAQADAPGLLGASNWVGRSFPLHASAPGKLVLAELDDSQLAQWVEHARPQRLTQRTITTLHGLRSELTTISAQGYAELDDELEPALASLAVTVRGTRGEALALVGVSGPSARLNAARRRALVGQVRAAAERIARAAADQR
jgi:DNA-binding IclR family transcriptional regulator